MTIREEMLQAAASAANLLGDARGLVVDFIRGQMSDDGGFKDRHGGSDLYYTVFGIECLSALQVDVPTEPVTRFLTRFENTDDLDLVHLACLGRCWANLSQENLGAETRENILRHIESCRTTDGGYSHDGAENGGTVYGCFLAFGAYQDLQSEMPDAAGLLRCLKGHERKDGAYANARQVNSGSTAATAAAITLRRHLDQPVDPRSANWLVDRCLCQGGFLAAPAVPMPDLLSTACALHALALIDFPLDEIRESCLDFIDSLWTGQGGFCANWADETMDCEYTYYGLLALGHLSR